MPFEMQLRCRALAQAVESVLGVTLPGPTSGVTP